MPRAQMDRAEFAWDAHEGKRLRFSLFRQWPRLPNRVATSRPNVFRLTSSCAECSLGRVPHRRTIGTVRLFGPDLVLLHPPSVYDFRESGTEYGPISDVIFSSPAFEMYPIGLTTIASHLEEHGFNVRIVNIAHRMLQDSGYDVEEAVAALDPLAFGIDLHWLPHAHGAVELARMIKRHHPQTPVMLGGLSASYFHRELIERPEFDFIVRGDSTEEPVRQLLHTFAFGGDFASIPNLTWKRPD